MKPSAWCSAVRRPFSAVAFDASPTPHDPRIAAIDIAPATYSTLIPAPTPTPVPTPAQPIPPNLADVLATCRIQGIAGDVVFMMDEVRRIEERA